jgi:hypothetical protein
MHIKLISKFMNYCSKFFPIQVLKISYSRHCTGQNVL